MRKTNLEIILQQKTQAIFLIKNKLRKGKSALKRSFQSKEQEQKDLDLVFQSGRTVLKRTVLTPLH